MTARRAPLRAAWHKRVPRGVPARGQAGVDRCQPAAGQPGLHDRGRRKRRARAEKGACGIAMGGVGSDIAVDAADIALVNDDIKALPHLLQLAKK